MAKWTRKYPDKNGRVEITSGPARRGDYVGPWIWKEITAAMKQLRHT